MNPIDDLKEKRISYVRVSDVIGKQTERQMRNIPIEKLLHACEKGNTIHDYCEAHLRNLFIPHYEPEYQPYINEFIRWCDENVSELIFSEVRLYDDERKFTGRFDAIVKLRSSNETALIDIKTSANSSVSWPVQLAAYKHLCEINNIHIDRVFNVHLKKIKSEKLQLRNNNMVVHVTPLVKAKEIEKKDLTPYWEIFSSCLKCYRYFEGKESDDFIA